MFSKKRSNVVNARIGYAFLVDTGRILFPFSSRGNRGRPAFDFGLFSEVEVEAISVECVGNKWDTAEIKY